jgi:ABC-2 type transport system ATP-binding protein
MPAPVIEVSNLHKSFDGRAAVRDLSFSVPQGSIFGLLGPNGAGKTTTIHLMLGLITPDKGAISIFGLDVQRHRYEVLSRVNFSSAYISLPTNLSVWEDLYIFARLYGVEDPKKRINETLELVEFGESRDRVVGVLSSGQRTRLNLCKALLNRPDVLFLDEPTASLDPDIALKVRTTLRAIKAAQKTTIVYTSHNMREVEDLCDHVIFLARGGIVTDGPPSEILRRTRTGSLEEVFITIARDGELKDIDEKPENG